METKQRLRNSTRNSSQETAACFLLRLIWGVNDSVVGGKRRRRPAGKAAAASSNVSRPADGTVPSPEHIAVSGSREEEGSDFRAKGDALDRPTALMEWLAVAEKNTCQHLPTINQEIGSPLSLSPLHLRRRQSASPTAALARPKLHQRYCT